MELTKRADGWWIAGCDPYYADGAGPFTDYGPYDTKKEAADDMRGLHAFEKEFQEECKEEQQPPVLVSPGIAVGQLQKQETHCKGGV